MFIFYNLFTTEAWSSDNTAESLFNYFVMIYVVDEWLRVNSLVLFVVN